MIRSVHSGRRPLRQRRQKFRQGGESNAMVDVDEVPGAGRRVWHLRVSKILDDGRAAVGFDRLQTSGTVIESGVREAFR
jgi:hypothetical protein